MRSHPSAVLRALRIDHGYGDRRILSDVSLTVNAGERIGLIGENGAGKSTLLRLLAGVETPDAGSIAVPADDRIGGRAGVGAGVGAGVDYLPQEVPADAAPTLGALVERAVAGIRSIETELESTAARLDTDPAAADRYARALAAVEDAGLWSLDARRDELLAAFGVRALDLDRTVESVSGGQRSRVALAALLLARPAALLLDEPTNHLDDAGVDVLSRTLREWRGPVLFASHDRAFLDAAATGLLDLDPSRGGTTRYGGGYTEYLGAKAAERARWEQRFAAEADEVVHLEHAVAVTSRQIAPGRAARNGNKMAYDFKSGTVQRQVSRRIRNARGRLDDLRASRVGEPPAELRFAGIPTGSHVLDPSEPLVTVEGVDVVGRLTVPSLAISADDRMLVVGPNGAGKSTLLALLSGDLAPDRGRVRRRRGLRVGLLGQDVRWPDSAHSARSLYEGRVGARRAETVPLADLGLLAPNDLDRPVGHLSIGQQRRVALALVIARPPHLFLLDEPTNHLSLRLASELEDALGTYPGAVLVATHDRWLRARWPGPALTVHPGHVRSQLEP